MIRTFFIIILLFFAAQTKAQKYLDVAASAGTAYYYGELNNSLGPIDDLGISFGAWFRRNYNARWAWKQQFRFSQIKSNDSNSPFEYQRLRNLDFYSNILEASSTVEFNFLRFDPWANKDLFTPYTYVGLSLFYMNPKTDLEGNTYELRQFQTENEEYSNIQFAIPFGFGIRLRLNHRVFMEFDWGMRRTFTDYIDDVSGYYPTNPDELSPVTADLSDRSLDQQGTDGTNWGTIRGNPKDNDWLFFSAISLVFNLNENPGKCYFKQDK